MKSSIIVTGGAGFIGSSLVRFLLEFTEHRVVNVDKLTYSGHRASVADIEKHPRYAFRRLDVADKESIAQVFEKESPAAVMHLAAESHVNRSIDSPQDFIQTNAVGTATLLECATDYWEGLPEDDAENFRFLNVSTDEVFGELGPTGKFTEETPYDPHSPYSASKAAADHFCRAWHDTYGLPVLISNCANNYGPRQFPEKLIPVVILNALAGDPIPVYGDGSNIRDWLHVQDHVRALWAILTDGRPGETYNVGADVQKTNTELVETICGVLDRYVDSTDIDEHASLIRYVDDRPGHDNRYAIDATKLRNELRWAPEINFQTGIEKTVRWYLDHLDWCEAVLEGSEMSFDTRQGTRTR